MRYKNYTIMFSDAPAVSASLHVHSGFDIPMDGNPEVRLSVPVLRVR